MPITVLKYLAVVDEELKLYLTKLVIEQKGVEGFFTKTREAHKIELNNKVHVPLQALEERVSKDLQKHREKLEKIRKDLQELRVFDHLRLDAMEWAFYKKETKQVENLEKDLLERISALDKVISPKPQKGKKD